METISLSDNEKNLIKTFVKEITKHPMVETIFVHAYREAKTKKDRIRVVCVFSFYTNYLFKLNRDKPFDFTEEEWKKYEEDIERYAVNTDRLEFREHTHMYYRDNPGLMTLDLDGGAMLFDRFDHNRRNERPIKYHLSETLKIENVQELLDKPKMKIKTENETK